MIISASRRTDIPNYYSKWFLNRIREKYVLVRNPFNIHQVSKIDLSPEVIDCIVFWSKNPKNMLDKLYLLEDYKYYFQFTVTSYSTDIERNIPSKRENIFDTFKRLSDYIGFEKVVWRYDPIIITDKYSIDYHKKYFEKIAKILSGYTQRCIISFIDIYEKVKRNMKYITLYNIDYAIIKDLSIFISEVCHFYNMKVYTCSEGYDLSKFKIYSAKCIDNELISSIIGYNIKNKKDKNQRLACGCIESCDIGAYNTCISNCLYCYASYSKNKIREMTINYDENSPILCDFIKDKDIIKIRKI